MSTDSPYTKEVGDTTLEEESMNSVILPEVRPLGHCWAENSNITSLSLVSSPQFFSLVGAYFSLPPVDTAGPWLPHGHFWHVF